MIVTNIKELKKQSSPVESVEEAREIISKLEEEMKKHNTAVGLSAIQIGIPKRISIINTKAGKFTLINPVTAELIDKFIFLGEGCLSFPEQYCDTDRYFSVIIDNQVIDGNSFRTERQYYHTEDPQKDVTTIAVQHEIDHHDGLVFYDRKAIRVPITSSNKTGRNDPCPCGSGKKYKKCCGTK